MIFIDTRERSIIPEELEQRYGIECKRETLQVGDYHFSNIGIEVKTILDFYNSIINKRIWKQLFSLKNTYPRPILIIIGRIPLLIDQESILKRRVIVGALSSILLSLNIPILFTDNEKDTAYIISALYTKSNKKGERPLPPKKYTISIREIRENILYQIPRLGMIKVKEIMKKYPRPVDLGEATIDELSKIKGISKDLASYIIKIWRGNSEDH